MANSKFYRNFQLFWHYFIGVGAIFGGLMMIIPPAGADWGMGPLLGYMQVLPWPEIFFSNFIFPGICLLIVNGLTNAVAIVLIYKRHRYAPEVSMSCGIILMLWIIVQFIIFPLNFMSTIYFIFGGIQTLFGYLWGKSLDGDN